MKFNNLLLFILFAITYSYTIKCKQYKHSNTMVIKSLKSKSLVYHNRMTMFSTENTDEIDETTKKYGLEAGLYKAITSKDEDEKKLKPKDLLAKYGIAYLATSITLAIISYAICYALISNGVDVASILEKIGIQSTSTASSAGTAALAYAVHKAASPIRFPPTVFLTPIVAGWLGKSNPPSSNTNENIDK